MHEKICGKLKYYMICSFMAAFFFPHHMVLYDYAANNQNITHLTLLGGLLHVEGKSDSV